jgi:hypothetical protein
MKAIDLSIQSVPVKKLLEMAGEDNVLLRAPDGRAFLLVSLDDFADEVELVRKNKKLMQLLAERSEEAETYSLSEVRKKLKLK